MNGHTMKECAQDKYLTEMFLSRKENAISEADKKYHGLLYSVIHTILKDDQDAEECLNDVYMKLWRSIPPNKPSSFRAYSVKIARNTAMSIFRKNTAEKRISKETLESFDDVSGVVFVNECEDEEKSQKIREIINSYLNFADERKMYIFMSRYYFDKPISEISKKLHCSESTVNKEIKRIKIELKKKLEEGGVYV